MSHAVAALPAEGLVLGRYRPVRPLGSGGSGSVWLARDERSGLDVALKIVPREGKAAPRAEREAAAAARLRHERCLRAYALEHDAGHVYIAYEYVPGRTLRDALRARELGDGDAVAACAQVLDGLAHAHARGIVHRDVKPANVLLADGGDVSVRLLDFGLAQWDEAETLTAMGDVPGTLAYISPERLEGGPATPAADVWAVGVMLWEALAGAHPFWKASVVESARAIERGAPPLASVRPELPKRLLAAVDAALALDPRRRPAAAELADALRRTARPARERRRRGARVRRPVVRRPRLVAPGALHPVLADAPPRLAGAALAGGGAWVGAAVLPFYPPGWAAAVGAAAAAAALASPRAGLALALAAPVLPLGNASLGAALAYAAAAAAWLVLFARAPRAGLLPAAGPLLGPVGALGLLPLAALPVRAPVRRALAAGAAVLAAALAAGVRGTPLPLTGDAPPPGLGIAGSEDALAVAGALWRALAAQPGIAAAAVSLALGAALLPLARARGNWALAAWGAGVLAAALLAEPALAAGPLVLAVWATCLALARKPWR